MLFKKTTLLFTFLTAITLFCGCAAPKSEEVTTSDEQLIAKSFQEFNKSAQRAAHTVFSNIYANGETKTETEIVRYDSEKELLELSYISENETITFYTKEDDGTYCYMQKPSSENEWYRFLDNYDDNEETSFEHTLNKFHYSFTKEDGYSDVTITPEGTETLNGVEALKFKIIAIPESYLEDEQEGSLFSEGKITRQEIIAEYEWSEESVNAVDGFSELLDEYVAFLNQTESETPSPQHDSEEYTVWIDAATSTILQLESVVHFSNADAVSADIEERFWDACWEVSWIQYDLDTGLTVDEAKELLEIERETVESQMQFDETENQDDTEEQIPETVTYITQFFTGSQCPDFHPFPESFTEITYEEYYNEYE